jgi:hypothetical protein
MFHKFGLDFLSLLKGNTLFEREFNLNNFSNAFFVVQGNWR